MDHTRLPLGEYLDVSVIQPDAMRQGRLYLQESKAVQILHGAHPMLAPGVVILPAGLGNMYVQRQVVGDGLPQHPLQQGARACVRRVRTKHGVQPAVALFADRHHELHGILQHPEGVIEEAQHHPGRTGPDQAVFGRLCRGAIEMVHVIEAGAAAAQEFEHT